MKESYVKGLAAHSGLESCVVAREGRGEALINVETGTQFIRLPAPFRFFIGRLPVELIYYEQYPTLDEARQREYSFKNGRTRRKTIDLLITGFPHDRLKPFV